MRRYSLFLRDWVVRVQEVLQVLHSTAQEHQMTTVNREVAASLPAYTGESKLQFNHIQYWLSFTGNLGVGDTLEMPLVHILKWNFSKGKLMCYFILLSNSWSEVGCYYQTGRHSLFSSKVKEANNKKGLKEWISCLLRVQRNKDLDSSTLFSQVSNDMHV